MAKTEKADIVLFGHSHKYSVEAANGTLYINPGSAGPARFRLKRTAAILTLPDKVLNHSWLHNPMSSCNAKAITPSTRTPKLNLA